MWEEDVTLMTPERYFEVVSGIVASYGLVLEQVDAMRSGPTKLRLSGWGDWWAIIMSDPPRIRRSYTRPGGGCAAMNAEQMRRFAPLLDQLARIFPHDREE